MSLRVASLKATTIKKGLLALNNTTATSKCLMQRGGIAGSSNFDLCSTVSLVKKSNVGRLNENVNGQMMVRNFSFSSWFKGGSPSKSESILPSMVTDNTIDGKIGTAPLSDDDLYRGLQLIHETPQHEYHAPLTFGEEHELFVGGHLPHSMPHINAIQDLLQYMHEHTGKQFEHFSKYINMMIYE